MYYIRIHSCLYCRAQIVAKQHTIQFEITVQCQNENVNTACGQQTTTSLPPLTCSSIYSATSMNQHNLTELSTQDTCQHPEDYHKDL